MAENNNLGDFQDKIENISDVLDSMRSQNDAKTDVLEKILTNISLKLETLSDEDNTDLIKVFLSELRKNLDERHNFVSSRFNEIEASFNGLVEKTADTIKSGEMRQIFDIIATNLGVFSTEVGSQKELLAELNKQIEEFKQDDSQKKDILKNISLLKVDLEKFNNGFQSIVLNLNDNFKSVSQEINKIDSTEMIDMIKKDIENIYFSSNAVLSTLQIIDRKNSEFEVFINTLVTKEEFTQEREQVERLMEQNSKLTEYISNLPSKEHIEDLSERVTSTIGIINILKNVLNETGEQNQKLLTAQLDNLETKILNISTEEEFIGFRKELSDFATAVIDSTNTMRAELAQTDTRLKDLADFLESVDIKNTFEGFANLTKVSEANVKESVLKISEDLTKEIEKSKNYTKNNSEKGVQELTDKLDLVKSEITENSQTNLSNIIEYVQSVINNIFSVKSTLQIENKENTEALDSKIQEVKDSLVASSNFLAQNSRENLESVLSNLENVFHEIVEIKGALDETSSREFQTLEGGFGDVSRKITEIKTDLNQNSQENFASIITIVDDFAQKVSGLQASLDATSQENSSEIKGFIGILSQTLSGLRDDLSRNLELNTTDLRNSIETISRTLQEAKGALEQGAGGRFAWLQANIEGLSQELRNVQNNIDEKNQSNSLKLISLFESLAAEFNTHREIVSSSSQANFDAVSQYVQGLGQKIEETKDEIKTEFSQNIYNLTELVSSVPVLVKENQAVFEEEQKVLIEQNSKNIEELIEKIQGLTRGILNKDNPFKIEVGEKLSIVKELLVELQDNLGKSNLKLEESFSLNVQGINDSLQAMGADYEVTLLNLQNKLVGYLNLIQDTTQVTDSKLEASISDISEIKSEIQSVLESISILNSDGKVADLATSINEKFEEVLSNIERFEEKSSLNGKENIQKVLAFTEEKLEGVFVQLEEYKIVSNEGIKSVIERVADKVSTIREQISLTNTDVLNALDAKTVEILGGFEPIRDLLVEISGVDFEKMFSEVKAEVELSQINLAASIKATLGEEGAELSQKISERFYDINSALNNFKLTIKTQSEQDSEEIKDALGLVSEQVELLTQANEGNQYELVVSKISETEQNLTQKYTEIKAGIDQGFEGNAALAQSALDELIAVKSDLLDEINKSKGTIIQDNSLQAENIRIDIEGLSAEISGINGAIAESSSANKEELLSEISALGENIDSIKGTLVEENSNQITNIKTEFKKVSDVIGETTSTIIQENVNQITNIKTEFKKVSDVIGETTSTIIQENFNQVSNIKSEFEKFAEVVSETKNALIGCSSVNKEEIKSSIAELGENIDSIKDSIVTENFHQSTTIKSELGKFSDSLGETTNAIIDGNSAQIAGMKTQIEELFSGVVEETKSVIEEGNSNQVENIKAELQSLVEEVNKAQEVMGSYNLDIADLLKVQDSAAKSQIAELENVLIEELSQNIEMFKTAVKSSSESIEEKITLSEQGYKSSLTNLLSDVKTSFYKNVAENLDDLKSFIEVVEGRHDYVELIDTLKADVFERFSMLADDVETSVASITVKDELKALGTKVNDSVSDLMDNLYDKILIAIQDDQLTQDVFTKSEEIARRVEDLKTIVTDDVADKLEQFGISIERQSQDFSNLISEIKVSLSELKETYIDLSVNSSMEISGFLTTIQDKIDDVGLKLETLDFQSVIESSRDHLMKGIAAVNKNLTELNLGSVITEGFDGVNKQIVELDIQQKITDGFEGVNKQIGDLNIQQKITEGFDAFGQKLDGLDIETKISNGLEVVNQKLDIIALDDSFEEELQEIKESIASQNGLLQNLKSLEHLEKISKIDGVLVIQGEIKKILSSFESKLSSLSAEKPQNTDQTSSIKAELNSVKKDVIETLLNIFEQISFIEETEEIKDFVEEKADEIKSTIKTSLGNNFNDILSSLDDLNKKTGNVDGTCVDIKKDINDVKRHLQLMQNFTSEEPDYSYTLQDVESDIAKVRLILDNISKVSPEGDFSKLNEDVMSISNRTNKLLLTSDESANILKESLVEFKTVVYQLDAKMKYFDSTEINKRIEQKLNGVNNLALSSVKSDKVFNQAFMYLAEWIDTASENLNAIEEKMETFSDKFEQQQDLIEKLETKIDKLIKEKLKPEIDVKAIIKEVLTQVEAKADSKVAKKVDNIEKQLTKLGKNIEKLASYVEE